jgi:hypothetical protein
MFDNADIESGLQFSDDEVRGRNDHLDWGTRPGQNSAILTDTVVSLHEFAHFELNQNCAYGAVLRALTYLTKVNDYYKSQCTSTIVDLVKRCRIAHEIYATWYSITMMKKDEDDTEPQNLLAKNKEYLNYFSIAEELVKEIPTIGLKHFILLSSINFCFQSKKIALKAENDLLTFSLSGIKNIEFPTKRLEILIDRFPPYRLRKILENYLSEKLNINNLRSNANLTEYFDCLTNEEQFSVFDSMNIYFQEMFSSEFELLGTSSFIGNEHYHFTKKLLETINDRYSIGKNKPFHFFSPDPTEIERNMMINFEGEGMIFANKNLNCEILYPEDVSQDDLDKMEFQSLDDPHLILEAANLITLNDQYMFSNQSDIDYFSKNHTPQTFIRIISNSDSKKVIRLVPFLNHEQLVRFIEKVPNSVTLYSSISYSASSNEDWWNYWGDKLLLSTKDFTFINDISLVLFIEEYLSDKNNVKYDHFVVKRSNRFFGFIVFSFTIEDGEVLTALSPCSDAFFGVLNYYMDKNHVTYKYDKELATKQYKRLEIFALSIVDKQTNFYYRNESLAKSKTQPDE